MQLYRCKCGKSTSWTTMGVPPCLACPECGSDLSQSPTSHKDPAPHEWIKRYDSHTGEPYELCQACLQRKPVPQ